MSNFKEKYSRIVCNSIQMHVRNETGGRYEFDDKDMSPEDLTEIVVNNLENDGLLKSSEYKPDMYKEMPTGVKDVNNRMIHEGMMASITSYPFQGETVSREKLEVNVGRIVFENGMFAVKGFGNDLQWHVDNSNLTTIDTIYDYKGI